MVQECLYNQVSARPIRVTERLAIDLNVTLETELNSLTRKRAGKTIRRQCQKRQRTGLLGKRINHEVHEGKGYSPQGHEDTETKSFYHEGHEEHEV
jgi:hypothetical protein